MHRRQTFRPDLAIALGSERADRNRREGRAETRRADLGDLLAERIRHDCKTGNVGRLALVGRHAERGVALQMLDRDEPLAMSEADVFGGHVVLEIDEGLAFGGNLENRGRRNVEFVGSHFGHRRFPADIFRSRQPGRKTISQGFSRREFAVEGAGADPALRRFRRQECLQPVVPFGLGAGLARQVDHRRPAAGNREAVCLDGTRVAAERSRSLRRRPGP